MWLMGLRLLAKRTISSCEQGTRRLCAASSGVCSNSSIWLPHTSSSECAATKASCRAKRSGWQISSVSMRHTHSCAQACKPAFSARPSPTFCGSRTIFSGRLPEKLATTASRFSGSPPSYTSTISFSGRVCAAKLAKHWRRYSGCSRAYSDINTENGGVLSTERLPESRFCAGTVMTLLLLSRLKSAARYRRLLCVPANSDCFAGIAALPKPAYQDGCCPGRNGCGDGCWATA